MDENQYQLGIRKLSPYQAVELICAYRNELKECKELIEELLVLASLNPIQRIICAQNIKRIVEITTDYRGLLKETEDIENNE